MNCVNALTGAKIRPVYTVQLSASFFFIWEGQLNVTVPIKDRIVRGNTIPRTATILRRS